MSEIQLAEAGQDIATSLKLKSLMNADKAAIKNQVELAVSNIHEGNIDALQALIYAKKGKELFDLLEKNVRPYAESQTIQKGYKAFNCEMVQKSGSASPDYTTCNDSVWESLQCELASIKEKIKVREAFLKVLPEPVASESTGELIHPPVMHYTKMSLALTIK